METAEILHQLEIVTGKFPRAAVEAAVVRREEITPELLRILEDTVDRAPQLDGEGDYMAHLYAMFLLAQFRERRAYPLVVRLAMLPGDLLDSLCGDFVTEDLGQVLASVCGGELEGIQSVIENEDGNEWARGAALGSLMTLVAAGEKSRDEIVRYFESLFRGKLVRRWSHVWDKLVSCSSDLYAEELLDDIKRAYEEDLVDPGYIGFDDVKCDLAMGKDRVLARLADDPRWRLVEDTVKEMGWWACFRDGRARAATWLSAKTTLKTAAPSQIKSTKPKTGRNQPCPCGSGKKYKKCCGRRTPAAARGQPRSKQATGSTATGCKRDEDRRPDRVRQTCQSSHIPHNSDLLSLSSILFYQTGYSICPLLQASRRSWRIGQRQPVRVVFLHYAPTMQESCLRLMGKKLLVSLAMKGKFSNEGLQANLFDGIGEVLSDPTVDAAADSARKRPIRRNHNSCSASVLLTGF